MTSRRWSRGKKTAPLFLCICGGWKIMEKADDSIERRGGSENGTFSLSASIFIHRERKRRDRQSKQHRNFVNDALGTAWSIWHTRSAVFAWLAASALAAKALRGSKLILHILLRIARARIFYSVTRQKIERCVFSVASEKHQHAVVTFNIKWKMRVEILIACRVLAPVKCINRPLYWNCQANCNFYGWSGAKVGPSQRSGVFIMPRSSESARRGVLREFSCS